MGATRTEPLVPPRTLPGRPDGHPSWESGEADRIASLRSYGLLDTAPEEDYDQIVSLVADICAAPIALVTLIDGDRQWFKATHGWDGKETSRAVSFCSHAIEGGDQMVVPDATRDERFVDNPFVTGPAHIRFYAGAVLRDREGRGLGTLCVLDQVPRQLSARQLEALATLGRQVAKLFELRRESASLEHAEKALAAAEGKGRRAVISLDRDLVIRGWSADAERLYGYPAAVALGRLVSEILETDGGSAAVRNRAEALDRSGWWEGDVVHHRRNGTPVLVKIRVDPQYDADHHLIGYTSINEDTTSFMIEQLCSETSVDIVARLANGEGRAMLAEELCRIVERVFAGSFATVMASDPDGKRLRLVSAPSLSETLRREWAEIPIGPSTMACGTAAYLGEVVTSPDISDDARWAGWLDAPRAEGLVSCWSQPIIGPAGSSLGTLAVYRRAVHAPGDDERQLVTTLAALAAIVFTARTGHAPGERSDGLTGLLTQNGIDTVLMTGPLDPEITVLCVRLDRFGLVNRQYGRDVGDLALREVARRLEALWLPGLPMARVAGDQFLLAGPRFDLGCLPGKMLAAVSEPMTVQGTEVWLSASIGLAGGRGDGSAAVVQEAMAAAERARRLGGNQVLDAQTALLDPVLSSLPLIGMLHRAVANDALEVHYQPKISLGTGRVCGVEALVRWKLKDGSYIPPARFVPLAEEIGLIEPIGEQVLSRACEAAASWVGSLPSPPGVAVNVSARQLVPGRLVEVVRRVLSHSGLPAGSLTLEVTETALADDLELATVALREVKELGVRVSIDDFGTGYSSLGYLSRLPIDELKIDRTFIDRLGADPAVDAIVGAVVSLGHVLGLNCVAEGVERPEQLGALTALGCDTYQGYLYSRPVPGDELVQLLSARGSTAETRAPTGSDGPVVGKTAV